MMTEKTALNLEPKVERVLCYVLGWITGLIFFFLERDNSNIRFHAMQSIILFGALTIILIGISIISLIFMLAFAFVSGFAAVVSGFFGLINTLIGLITLVLWIYCLVKAYQNKNFRLPFVGDLAEKIIG